MIAWLFLFSNFVFIEVQHRSETSKTWFCHKTQELPSQAILDLNMNMLTNNFALFKCDVKF